VTFGAVKIFHTYNYSLEKMPINLRKVGYRKYYQFGNSGKKYFFDPHSKISQGIAYQKVLRQVRAIKRV